MPRLQSPAPRRRSRTDPPTKSSRCGARSTTRSDSALCSSVSGARARRHQPVVQPDIGRGEMRDKGAVEADQPVAVIEIGEGKPVFQGEFGHGS